MKTNYRKYSLITGAAVVAALALIQISFAASPPNGGGSAVWSPDGKALLFVSATPNTPVDLWVASWHDGPGTVSRLTTGGGRFLAWALDGKSLLYRTQRGGASAIYAASLTGEADPQVLSWLPPTAVAIVISPDMKQVAYTLPGEGKRNLWVADFDGANARQLTTKVDVRTPAWSPDGARLAYDIGPVYGEATFLIEAAGGEPKVIFGGIGSYPSWSPDGKWLVALGMHAATLIPADGGEIRRLHISQDDRIPLSWSPDSKFAIYAEALGATRGIGRVEVETGKTETLTKDWVRTASAQYSPDGRSIAFEALKPGESAANLHVLDVQSKRDRQVTTSTPSEWLARSSGDGAALFFLSNRTPRGTVSVFRKNLKSGRSEALLQVDTRRSLQMSWPPGSPVGVLVHGASIWLLSSTAAPRELIKTEHPTGADLSPNGDRLVYVKWTEHRSSLVVRQLADDSEQEVLAPPEAGLAYSKPAWSARDDIAFLRGDTLCRLRLSDGGTSELMSAGEGGVFLSPVWSQRGEAIAMGRYVPSPAPTLEIWTMGPSGQEQRLVAAAPVTTENGWLADPLALPYAWSPRGRLAYVLEQDGLVALHVADLQGEAVTRSPLRMEAAYPEWSSNGQEIMYTDLSGNREAIARLRVPPAARPRPESGGS